MILLIKYLNSGDELLLKYFAADLLVSSISFLISFNMDISANLAIYNERFGFSRPKALKQLPGGGWSVDLAKSHRSYVFLGEIDSLPSAAADESSAIFLCAGKIRQCGGLLGRIFSMNSSKEYPAPGVGGKDSEVISSLQGEQKERTRKSSLAGFNTHWIGDYSSDDSPSPTQKSSSGNTSSYSIESPRARQILL